jgi:hypothetical protein
MPLVIGRKSQSRESYEKGNGYHVSNTRALTPFDVLLTLSNNYEMADQPPNGEAPQQIGDIVFLDPAQVSGVWANFARVSQSAYEFTLDFVRLDYTNNPPNGVVVARVSVSPLFITQLIDVLQEQWTQYAERALPMEARDDPQ